MKQNRHLRQYRWLWVSSHLVAFLVVTFFSLQANSAIDANPTLQNLEAAKQTDAAESAPAPNAQKETEVAEATAETEVVEIIPAGESRLKLSLESVAPDFRGADSDVKQKLLTEEDIKGPPSLLERMYQERPYAKDSGLHYDRTLRFENGEDNPFRNESQLDYQRMRDEHKSQWRSWQKGLFDEQARDVVQDIDTDSAPMQAYRSVNRFFGGRMKFGEPRRDVRKKNLKSDGSISAEDYDRENTKEEEVARVYLTDHTPRPVEESRPLKLRSRMNLPKRSGEMMIENALLDTGARVDVRADDRLELKARREFKKIGLTTGGYYGFEKNTVGININKSITNELSCELHSLKSERVDVVSEKQVRLNYSIGF